MGLVSGSLNQFNDDWLWLEVYGCILIFWSGDFRTWEPAVTRSRGKNQLLRPRRIRRREKPFLTQKLHRTSPFQPAKPTQANTAVLKSRYITSVGGCCYILKYVYYFALVNLNLKLQFSAKASFSLLLILLGCWEEVGPEWLIVWPRLG